MDFANAALLIAAAVGIVTLAKTAIWGTTKERITAGVVFGASEASVFLVGATFWAHEQVIGNQTLSDLGVWDKVLVGLLLSGGASAVWEVLRAVKNVGENQKPPAAEAADPRALRHAADAPGDESDYYANRNL